MQLNTLVGISGEVLAVGRTVGHAVARKQTAVACTVRVKEAVGVHRQHAVVRGGDLTGKLTGHAERGRHFDGKAGRILADGQHAAIALAGDAYQQDSVLCVDGQHLLSERRLDGGALIVKAGFVDVDMIPAVCQRIGILRQIGLHGAAVQLPEQLVEGILGLLLQFLRRQLIGLFAGLMGDVGVNVGDVVVCRAVRRGRRIGLAPG